MKKRDFETYHKRFRDFEILTKFSETHVFRGTIRHPLNCSQKSTRFLRGALSARSTVLTGLSQVNLDFPL